MSLSVVVISVVVGVVSVSFVSFFTFSFSPLVVSIFDDLSSDEDEVLSSIVFATRDDDSGNDGTATSAASSALWSIFSNI